MDVDGTVEEDLGKSRDGSRTDDEVVQRWVAHRISTCQISLNSGHPRLSRLAQPSLLNKVNVLLPMLMHTNAKFLTCSVVI